MDDSQHLLLEWFDTICDSPSQIYHSALPFCPPSSWLHKYYSAELQQEVKVVKGLPTEWGACSRTVVLDHTPLALACWRDTIAVSLKSGNIAILDGATGSQEAILSGHTDWVGSVVFSPDGTLLISGSHDNTVKLWDVQTGGMVNTFYGHTKRVYSVSISVNCITVASGSDDMTIRLWDVQMGECYCVIKQQRGVHHVRFSPTDPQYLISVSDSKVWQWDINGHQIKPTYDGSYAAFSSDGTQFVLCHGEAVVVQNSNSGVIKTQLHMTNNHFKYCCFSPDDSLVAVATSSTVYVWDITSLDHSVVEMFVGHIREITSLSFSSPSSLISSCHDKSVKFWQIGTLLTNSVLSDPKSTPLASAPIKFITLQGEDGIAISIGVDGVIKIWDISTGLCKVSFQAPVKDHKSDIKLVDNRLIFVWQANKKIHMWDIEKGEIQLADAPWDDIMSLRISGDGSKIFCLQPESIQAWSIWTGKIVGKVELGHPMFMGSTTVDGSRIWVHPPSSEPQGWDFGISGSPTQLSKIPPPNLPWDIHQSRVRDPVTGKVIFELAGRFAEPVCSQWNGQYLVAGYKSGEVLILDFTHILSSTYL